MRSLLLPCLLSVCLGAPCRADSPELESALKQAGANRAELERALKGVDEPQRVGMRFLIENMPPRDLKSLTAEFLITHVKYAYRARGETPWGKQVPEERFLNDVLPYANVDETREEWRSGFYELCMPMVKECKTATEAVQKLNAELFPKLKVKYSTARKAPNQSPKESIDQGLASCTGLSIILSNACRSVGIPARLVGTPLWANQRGNHTWVEIWDGDWHFTGACEPDPKGLDRGWFVGDAAQAKKDSFENAIYAARFRKSDVHFPLVWAMRNRDVPGENVTDRYAKPAPASTLHRLRVRVVDAAGKRVEATVELVANDYAKQRREGKSRGETADRNDLLSFEVPPESRWVVQVGGVRKEVRGGAANSESVVEIALPAK